MMSVMTVTPSVKKQGLRRQQHIRTTKERRELGRQGGESWEGKEMGVEKARRWELGRQEEAGVGKAASHNNGGFGYAGLWAGGILASLHCVTDLHGIGCSVLQNRESGTWEVRMPPNTAVYHRTAEATGQVTNGIGDLGRVRRLS